MNGTELVTNYEQLEGRGSSTKVRGMDKKGNLRFATQSLFDEIEGILRKAADAYPYLDRPAYALRRMAKVAGRPLRVGLLGEANSGKSSLANLLVGTPVLPASPLANAGLPALLTYAPKPYAAAIYESGERVTFPLLQDVAQTVAAIQDCAAVSALLAGRCVRSGGVKFLEAGLPREILRSVEILDLPAGCTCLPGYGMDAAIWTTVATQAWRESERAQWAKLPRRVRSRSFLAVTFCDLVADRENNLKRLQARLETSAKPFFQGICFVENGAPDLAAVASSNKVLFSQIQYLAYQFAAERFGKAMAIAHRLMAKAAAKDGPATKSERSGLSSHAVAEASKGLFDGNLLAALKRPRPEGKLAKRSMPHNGHAYGAAAIIAARRTAQAGHFGAATGRAIQAGHSLAAARRTVQAGQSPAVAPRTVQAGQSPAAAPKTVQAGQSPAAALRTVQTSYSPAARERSTGRPRWMTASAAAAVAGAITLAVIQLGLIGTEKSPVSNPLPGASEAALEQSIMEKGETRRTAEAEAAAAVVRSKAEVEAAAAGEHREAQAETAAAELREKALAEAVAAEARGKAMAEATAAEVRREAQAEAVAETKWRKKAEAGKRRMAEPEHAEKRWRTAAEAAPRQFSRIGPIMHGISQ